MASKVIKHEKMIPYLDLRAQYLSIKDQIDAATEQLTEVVSAIREFSATASEPTAEAIRAHS